MAQNFRSQTLGTIYGAEIKVISTIEILMHDGYKYESYKQHCIS